MQYIIIPLVALVGSGLTFFSGFGLGTLLVPIFGLFFSIDLAIALTAIVHFLNNVFKLTLVGKYASKKIVLLFGIPSIIGAFVGAFLLLHLTLMPQLYTYFLFSKMCVITPIKLVVALLLFTFALFELLPKLKNLQINKNYLALGGLLSGFFGGLSGNQGALRTAFLSKVNLSKQQFIATGVVIACMIDVSRLSIYAKQVATHQLQQNYLLIGLTTLAAFLGAFIGNKLLTKVTISFVQNSVTIMLVVFALLLCFGIL